MSTSKQHGHFYAYLGKFSLKDWQEKQNDEPVSSLFIKTFKFAMKEKWYKVLELRLLQLKCTLQNNFNKASRRKGFYCCGDCILTCMPHFNKRLREKREKTKQKPLYTDGFLILNKNCHSACYSSLITNDKIIQKF